MTAFSGSSVFGPVRWIGLLLIAVLLIAPAAAHAKPRTIISIEFDDAYADQWNMRDVLKAHGIPATFFLNSDLLGKPGYMTVNQLLALQGDGHEMAGHTRDHLNLPDLTPEEQTDQICGDRSVLNSEDLAAHDFAYPNGSYTPATESIIASCGYNSGRTAGGITPPLFCAAGCRPAESLPAADPLATLTVPLYVPAQGFKALRSYVLNARKKARHGWVQFVFHHVCNGCDARAVTPVAFRQFLDWLKSPKIAPTIKLLRVDQLTGLPGPGR
jgi:peptidoglycan/xylan/chitin deacetylase (PgdA/CDA1 family)